jgi:hypothetical protein
VSVRDACQHDSVYNYRQIAGSFFNTKPTHQRNPQPDRNIFSNRQGSVGMIDIIGDLLKNLPASLRGLPVFFAAIPCTAA